MRIEAVNRDYGRWDIDNEDLIIRFIWGESITGEKRGFESLSEVPVKISNNVDRIGNVGHEFSISDLELSLSLGMDLESDIRDGVLLILDCFLIDDNIRKDLKLEVSDFIGRRFSGFKTYNETKR